MGLNNGLHNVPERIEPGQSSLAPLPFNNNNNKYPLCWDTADQLRFSVKISSSWRKGSAIAKLKQPGEPKVIPKYGKISSYRTLKIVVA